MHKYLPAAVISFLLAGIVLILGIPSVNATTFTVTTLDDELNSDGDCSLREAITAANTNAAVDACPAGEVGMDMISFGVNGTILLDSTLPAIEDHLVLSGPGAANLILSGNSSVSAMTVTAGILLDLTGLTIADALGSGIVNSGTLSVTSSVFTNNKGGWINIEDDDLQAGGAIRNYGTLFVQDSTFSSNWGSDGSESGLGGAI